MSKDYIDGLQLNKEITTEYYTKSMMKTEQQKFLENILIRNQFTFHTIADIACGGGTLSYHLHKLYPGAEFYLVDLNPDALDLAKSICTESNFHFSVDDIYQFKTLPLNFFDVVFCWQTLSWIDEPKLALEQMLSLVKPGGKLYLSSLFNLDHDVDIYAKLTDHTRQGNTEYAYNTYSKVSIEKWVAGIAQQLQFYPFEPPIDFLYEGRGLGTYTLNTGNKRLQISAGLLLNWAILEITK
jgi:ubiquinone/menaquinone biosynthesis C-methylase UbiE